ncbi:MAG: Protein phosphatase 1 regulatory subunit sds22 [Chrysothrix sp. TS-e1954]|nr:MAG: Protein phosphatase 1 regulatory subunit sds22 [Chrysothrix sp. TS-e1954]
MSAPEDLSSTNSKIPRDSKGWDGKLRLRKKGTQGEAGELSPVESENGDGPEEVTFGEPIQADEDALDEYGEDETDIDLNHFRITSIPALRLERFQKLERLCLRQNSISKLAFPESWGGILTELDLYDNAIGHVKGLDGLTALTSLDLSFNKIKHIKGVNHLEKVKDLYFVQNKITQIEGLDGMTSVTNLELAGNRIRDIENLETLVGIKELWLGKNKITELKNLHNLQNLTTLSIQSNRLTSDSLDHLSSLPNLSELYISHNALTHIKPLAGCASLTTIDVSSNPITSIEGLSAIIGIEEVWASDCQLEDFADIERELSDKKALNTVYFEGNPLQRRQPAVYRNKVKLALPQIRQIDANELKKSITES